MRLYRPQVVILQLVACFFAGVLSCVALTYFTGASAPLVVHVPIPQSKKPQPPCPAILPNIADQTVDDEECSCASNGTAHSRTPKEMEAWHLDLDRRSRRCVDEVAKRRMGIAMRSNVLGQCALEWLAQHASQHLNPGKPQVLFDYTYDAMDYPFTGPPYSDWLQLLSFLPQDSLAMPERKGAAPNQILLGTPIRYRLKSFFATSTFMDVQLALRFDEMATYATPIDPLELIAKIVSMARHTYLVLSCTPFSDMTDADAVRRALELYSNPSTPLGIRHIEAKVEEVAVFKYESCVKPLLKVTLTRLDKVGRAKWCYYPSKHFGRFHMKFANGHLTVTDMSTKQAVQVKHTSQRPYVPLSEILGWGVVRDTRELWFAFFAAHKVCSSMATHNVVLLAGGTFGCRPTPFLLGDGVTHPTGKHYLAYLQVLTCTGHGQKWRVLYEKNTTTLAYHTTSSIEFKFEGDSLYRMSRNGWKLADEFEPQASSFQDDAGRPICGAECLRCFQHFTTIDTVASECAACYGCLAPKKQSHFLAQSFIGCHDQEGVTENGLQTPGVRCFDTQREPLPRPSAPAGFL